MLASEYTFIVPYWKGVPVNRESGHRLDMDSSSSFTTLNGLTHLATTVLWSGSVQADSRTE